MKSYLIGLMTALLMVVAGTTEAAPKRIKGSGNIVTKTVEVGDFNGITASRAIDVKLVEGKEGTVTISADDNLIEWVRATISRDALHLTIDDDIRTISDIHVTITVPTDGKLGFLKAMSAAEIESDVRIVKKEVEIKASSSAEVKADIIAERCTIETSSAGEYKGEVKSNFCHANASSSAEIEMTLTTQKCYLNASSAAEIAVKGAALGATLNASSAADIQGEHFAVKRCHADASSAGEIAICCLEEFNGNASSAGDIRVYGKPERVSKSASSGGSIQNK
jgi:hypothetical protein